MKIYGIVLLVCGGLGVLGALTSETGPRYVWQADSIEDRIHYRLRSVDVKRSFLIASSLIVLVGAIFTAAGVIADNQRETKHTLELKLNALLAIWEKLQVKSRGEKAKTTFHYPTPAVKTEENGE